MLKSLLLTLMTSLLHLTVLSMDEGNWQVICPSDSQPYLLSVTENASYTQGMFKSLNSDGVVTSQAETFVAFFKNTIRLQIIEANQLRSIWMDMPSGDLLKTSKVVWQKSPYMRGVDSAPDVEIACYDVNGVTKEIAEKIEASVGFTTFKQAVEMELDQDIGPVFDYQLVMVEKHVDETRFLIEVRWSIPKKNCVAVIETNGDFSVIKMRTDSNGTVAECDWT